MNCTRINTVECITRYWKSVLIFIFLGFLIFLIHWQLVQDQITISRRIYLGIQAQIPNQPDVSDYSSLLKQTGHHLDSLQKINNDLVATIKSTKSNHKADSQALTEATETLYKEIKKNYDNFSLNLKSLELKYIKITNSALLIKKNYPYEVNLYLDSIKATGDLALDTLKLEDLLEKRAVFQPALSSVEVSASVGLKQLIKLFFGYETTSLILCFIYLRYKNK